MNFSRLASFLSCGRHRLGHIAPQQGEVDSLTHLWRFGMKDALPDGGIIRKMWAVEASRYRDHLLRLDEASRHNRFGGNVTESFLWSYADLALGIDTVIHGFFVNGTMRGAAELRAIGQPSEAEAAFSIEKPWQSH